MDFIQLLQKRRSIYNLGRNVSTKKDKINKLILEIIRQSPSSFNSQSASVIVAYDKKHEEIWNITQNELDKIQKKAPNDAKNATKNKINSFKQAFGTILIYEDQDIIKNFQDRFPAYKENFQLWSEQSTGIVTQNLWMGLSELDLGVNLQHYNPIIDEPISKLANVTSNYRLCAQLVFGSIEKPAEEKQYIENEKRFRELQ